MNKHIKFARCACLMRVTARGIAVNEGMILEIAGEQRFLNVTRYMEDHLDIKLLQELFVASMILITKIES